VGFVVDKAAQGLLFSDTLVSPEKHSTDCSTLIIIIIIRGWYKGQ
jgi:hypothetical protein